MALTLSQVMSEVRSRYNSAAQDPFFSDEYLRGLVFEAEAELAKEGWVIEDTVTTTSVEDVRELNFPENTLAIKEIRYDYKQLAYDEIKFDPKTNSTDPTGTPRKYGVWDDVIFLFPTPDTSGDTIQVRRFVYPSFPTSNVSPMNVPCEYQTDIINYVLAHMSMKDQNLPLAQIYLGLWQQAVLKAKAQRKKRLRKDRIARVKDLYFGSDDTTFGQWGYLNGTNLP